MSINSSVPDDAPRRTGPEPFVARTLSASLTVKDLERSLAWYQDVLGFIVDRKYEREGKLRAVALKAGDVLLLIGQDDGAKGWERVKGDGLSLTITTDQDVDAIAHRIKQLGGILESEPVDMPMGGRIFRLLDPDGFKFAISSAIRPKG
jgi:predicted enzyme related to lactoylglutathione lyase